jgi:carbonic anhydrase
VKSFCFAIAVCGLLGAQTHPPTASEAVKLLIAGNQRYLSGHLKHPHQTGRVRHELAKEQHPFAALLSCSDSRVPPEIIFDEGLGDLFVVRVAGNIVDDAVTGSLEYAAEHLHVPAIIVMGHLKCGAVTATVEGGEPHTHIEALTNAIQPAVKKAQGTSGDLVTNAIRANVEMVVEQLKSSKPILAELVAKGKLEIRGAIYDVDSGKVEFLP